MYGIGDNKLMGKDLSELASYFRPLAQRLIVECDGAGVPVRIVDTGRTETEQEQKLAQGVSWVPRSKHEPQPPEMLSEAIDVVPLSILEENKPNWDPDHPDWQKIGQIGMDLGLRWGGSWVQHPDPSHFEYKHG
jgi:peptidoglycan LD-endopeptidase CwlK